MLIFFFLLIPLASGHVSFLFPTARYPPLDYLDAAKTRGPCGVPLPQNPQYTNLQVGTVYNISWRMAFQHQGGYRITLLDKNGHLIEQLSPLDGLNYTPDEDGATYERIRFTSPCENCILLLERQALEWSSNFMLRTCADVNIMESVSDKCNNAGRWRNNQCQCDAEHSGTLCQYKADCHVDDDCQNGGKCVKEEDSLIQRVCYCTYGYFGAHCQYSGKFKSDECFAYEERNEANYEMHGIFNPNCYNVYEINADDKIYFREIQNDVEIILDYASEGWVSLGWRPEQLDPSCRLFPDLEHNSMRREKRKAGAPPRYIEQEGPRPQMPSDNGFLPDALHAPLHPMDCMDMIVGRFKAGRGRIEDRYSRDRSTPLEDYWFDGEMSLSAAYSVQSDGRAILMFRRMQQEIEPTDHPLGPHRLFVSWAKGPSMSLSYHGPRERGSMYLDFTVPVKPTKSREDKVFGVNIAKNIYITPPPHPTGKVSSNTPETESTMSMTISTVPRIEDTVDVEEPENMYIEDPVIIKRPRKMENYRQEDDEEQDSSRSNQIAIASTVLPYLVITYVLI